MHPIPTPHVLDPDHYLDDNRTAGDESRVERLEAALAETCAYGRQLWQNLDAVRGYLMASLPSDPRRPGPHPTFSAAPTGPDDEEGWAAWIATYAAATSVLCGPQGDSGLGASEARDAARARREAPNVKVLARFGTRPDEQPPERRSERPGRLLRAAGLAALALLAVRGLRPPTP
jgi:hypothetical protein